MKHPLTTALFYIAFILVGCTDNRTEQLKRIANNTSCTYSIEKLNTIYKIAYFEGSIATNLYPGKLKQSFRQDSIDIQPLLKLYSK